jgi:hypothetical protein
LWTDEAAFSRSEVNNIHNLCEWAPETPHVTQRSSFQKKYVNIQAGIGLTKWITCLCGIMYADFLEKTLPLLLEDVLLNFREGMCSDMKTPLLICHA